MRKYILLLPLVILAVGFGQELLVNGDFEQELSVGWTQSQNGSGTHTIDRAVGYHPDPDYEAQTYQYDNPGWTRLGQTVDVPSTLLELSFWASFEEAGGSSSCWPAACFSVCYYNSSLTLLGETRYYYSTYANWVPTGVLSLCRVTSPGWTQYTLNIADELSQNLPGVNPGDVARIEVALYSYTCSG
jgi:hypothetical protein